MMQLTRKTLFSLLILLLVSGGLLSGCSVGKEAALDSQGLAMAPMSGMPEEVQAAPTTVQQAYQFNVANPELMQHIPCYCGCGNMGHTSNYSCYVQDVDSQGVITYDTHALGCSICVDITLDAMRLLKQGKTLDEIRSYVDTTYSQYGPSNIPAP